MGARSGRRLVAFDRRLGERFVAGADEAGRGSLAGPLVAAAVLLDYADLRGRRLTPLAALNDSKQLLPEERERLFHAVLRLAARVSVQVVSPGEIDRAGLHRSNLRALASALRALGPAAGVRLVDGFRLGPTAPPHRAVVDGDQKSAAVAAASVVAKVVRDRAMRRLDALYPAFGFVSHVGYITPGHSAVVRRRGPCALHRRSFQALCYVDATDPELEVDSISSDLPSGRDLEPVGTLPEGSPGVTFPEGLLVPQGHESQRVAAASERFRVGASRGSFRVGAAHESAESERIAADPERHCVDRDPHAAADADRPAADADRPAADPDPTAADPVPPAVDPVPPDPDRPAVDPDRPAVDPDRPAVDLDRPAVDPVPSGPDRELEPPSTAGPLGIPTTANARSEAA